MNQNGNSGIFLIIVLGMLAAFGPLVTDMYLPALPAMTLFFGTTVSMVQSGITASMLGLAMGQLLIGPLSDKYGRRRPLKCSMWLFIVSTILCIYAWNIEAFLFFRFVQGIAGSGGIVLSRSISADLYSGRRLAKFLAVIAAVQGLAPVGAPLLGGGGLLLGFTDWKGIFWALFAIGVIITALCYFVRETLPLEKRNKGSLGRTFALFLPVLKNRSFMLYVGLLSFAMAVMFAFIASSPFIFQDYYNLSPLAFSVYFAVNAFAVTAGAICSARFRTPVRAVKAGAYLLLPLAAVTAAILVSGQGLVYISGPLFSMLFAAGLIFPSAATLALENERQNAGTASAVLGSLNFIFGGIVTPLVGLGNILWSTAIVFVVCALMAAVLAVWVVRKR